MYMSIYKYTQEYIISHDIKINTWTHMDITSENTLTIFVYMDILYSLKHNPYIQLQGCEDLWDAFSL